MRRHETRLCTRIEHIAGSFRACGARARQEALACTCANWAAYAPAPVSVCALNTYHCVIFR